MFYSFSNTYSGLIISLTLNTVLVCVIWSHIALPVTENIWISRARTMSSVALGSRSRVYADVNTHKPREYWDYESHPIEWG